MKVQKITKVSAYTTDNREMVIGKEYVFEIAEYKCLCGIYQGISRKGALKFLSLIRSVEVQFNIMPNSIENIFEANIEVQPIPFTEGDEE